MADENAVGAPTLNARRLGGEASPYLLSLALFAVTLVAYAPAISAGFIWNDADYVTAPALRSTHGLARVWFELGATEQYYPLLHSAFWVEHRLWGDAAAGYHLLNILLHATSACLLAAVVGRLWSLGGAAREGGEQQRQASPTKSWASGNLAWLAAFVFALHPVCVESVAWISEQKNTLSLVFYLLAAWWYLRFDVQRSPRAYVAATIVFGLALLTKTTTATLPAALLVALWWRRGRLQWRRDVVPLVPWFVLGAGLGLVSAYVERKYVGAEGADFALTLLQRALLAGRVVWFYLGKLGWPGNLIFIYPRWRIDPAEASAWIFGLAVVLALVGCWLLRRRTRGPLAAALFFGGSLFPVLGFFNVYAFVFSFVADHWQYLPCIGVVVLAAAGLRTVRGGPVLPLLLIGALGVLTFQQSRMYADMRTFYRTTLARNPAAWMAHNNLANLLREEGDLAGAVAHLRAALAIRPDLAKVHNNLANCLRDLKRPTEAIEEYQRALAWAPDYVESHNHLGSLLRELGRTPEAVVHLLKAVQLDPQYPDARNNLGMALRDAGRLTEAIAQFELSLRDNPNSAPLHLNLALSYSLAGRDAEAMQQFREARRLNPAIPDIFGR